MYAIVRTGGKQYQVAAGDTLRVEKLKGEIGDTVELADVLLVADGDNVRVGTPAVEGAKVVAKIVDQGKAKKVLVFKKKKRKDKYDSSCRCLPLRIDLRSTSGCQASRLQKFQKRWPKAGTPRP